MSTLYQVYEYIRTYPIVALAILLLIGWCVPVWYISLVIVLLSVVGIVVVHQYTHHEYLERIEQLESANEELRAGIDSAIGNVYAQYEAVKCANKALSAKRQASDKRSSITRRQFVQLMENAFYLKDHSREVLFNGTRVIFVGHGGGVKELSLDGVRDAVAYKTNKRMAASTKPLPQLPEPDLLPLHEDYQPTH